MRTVPWIVGVLGWFIALPIAGSGANASDTAKSCWQAVRVLTGNYARVPQELLAAAQLEAERILSDANMVIDWVDAPTSPMTAAESRAEPPLRPRPTLHIQLLSRAMGARLHRPSNEFGLATGSTGYIFYDRIEGIRLGVISRSSLLGHVLAHEIGHLLLGKGAHAPNGLMQPNWYSNDLVHLGQGGFRLTLQQMERLRGRPINGPRCDN